MIEMVLHEVYEVQFSHHMNRTIVVVLKAQEQNRYVPICNDFNHAHSLVDHLRGEVPERSSEPKLQDEAIAEYLRINRSHGGSFNVFIRFREDDETKEWELGVHGITVALERNLPIYVDEDLLDELGVDEPTDFNQAIKSVQPLDRSKRED
ncbi:MAG TPA: hypothetical protein VM821_02150 [Abditibacteriaceae bacterium]|jgi:bifunctional DNase/RNase|nr:hypothetical protein [Abditibacteriaceae bacterium]